MGSDVSDVLFAAWRRGPDPGFARDVASAARVPDDVVLRGRYLLLTNEAIGPLDPVTFQVSRERFAAEHTLIGAGNRLLEVDDSDGAREAFTAVLPGHDPAHHPMAAIDAQIGLGDTARQEGDWEQALKRYVTAITDADASGHRLGSVRARIAMGYLHLSAGASRNAATEFSAAAQAASGDMSLERGNAFVGLCEAQQRLGDTTGAYRSGLAAIELFAGDERHAGRANAFLALGEAARRRSWTRDAAGWFLQSLQAARRANTLIATVNALDGLAECLLVLGDRHGAIDALHQALELTASAYTQGRALVLNGLGRVAAAGQHWNTAWLRFRQADLVWHFLDQPLSAATSERGLAECAHHLGDLLLRVYHDVRAVMMIEEVRAGQSRSSDQDEYAGRFTSFYEHAVLSAIDSGSVTVFMTVFEAVAGHRIGALLRSEPPDSAESRVLAQLMVETDRRTIARLQAHRRRVTRQRGQETPEPSRQRRVAKALDARALTLDLPTRAQATLDDSLAELYRPLSVAAAGALSDRFEHRQATLLCPILLTTLNAVAWLVWPPNTPGGEEQAPYLLSEAVDPDVVRLVERLHTRGLDPAMRPDELGPLRALLPNRVLGLVPIGSPLLLVPPGPLWSVPWAALPAGRHRFLSMRNPLRFAPTLAAAADTVERLPSPPRGRVVHWRNPTVVAHTIEGAADSTELRSATAAKTAMLHGGDVEMLTVLAHGTPRGAFTHTIDLDATVSISPADVIGAATPRRLALIACWGANAPGRHRNDAVTVATLAVTRSTDDALATNAELLDDAASAFFVDLVLDAAGRTDFSTALFDASRLWLSSDENSAGPIARWAPLIALGPGRGGTA